MAKCNWDPNKHEGRPCPIHGSGMWDENILTRKDKIEKLKEKGYTQEEIEEELKDEKFDEDFDWEEKEEVKEDNEEKLSEILSKEIVRQDDADHTSDDLDKIAKKYNVDRNALAKQWEKENVIYIEDEKPKKEFDKDEEKDFTYEEESALKILKSVLNHEQWEAIKNNKKYIEGYLSGQFTPRDLKMAAQITLEFQNKSKDEEVETPKSI